MPAYSQPPPMNEKEIESFLDEAKVARLCTHNEDGTIHVIPVWFKYDHDTKKILIGAPATSRKARNVRRNSDVTVEFDVEGPPTRGLIVYGKAEVHEASPEEVVSRGLPLYERYMSEDKAMAFVRGVDRLARNVAITITPVKFASFDYSKDELFKKAMQEQS